MLPPIEHTFSRLEVICRLTKWEIKCGLKYVIEENIYRNELTVERMTLKINEGVPWCLGHRESICQCRRHRFDPWSGKIPYAMGQLSPCAMTAELGS